MCAISLGRACACQESWGPVLVDWRHDVKRLERCHPKVKAEEAATVGFGFYLAGWRNESNSCEAGCISQIGIQVALAATFHMTCCKVVIEPLPFLMRTKLPFTPALPNQP